MAKLRDFKKSKTCPRCNEKCDLTQDKCTDCGLVFARLELGSNKLAKKKILSGNKDEVVYNRGIPKDVKKWKLLVLSIFLGIFGAHNIYVGRFWKGAYMAICGLLSIACVTFTSFSFTDLLLQISVLPCGIMGFMWLFDMVDIFFGRFRIPIAISVEEQNKWKQLLLV